MGKNDSPSAKQITARDLGVVNRAASKMLRASARGQKGSKAAGVKPQEHWSAQTVTVHGGNFAFLLRPKHRLLPGFFAPFFWTMRCEEILMVGISGNISSTVWSAKKGSDIGTHRIWADCRKCLPEVSKQIKGLQQSMLALADLDRYHPTEVTGVPYLFGPKSELIGQRATSLTASTTHTRREIELAQIELLDL